MAEQQPAAVATSRAIEARSTTLIAAAGVAVLAALAALAFGLTTDSGVRALVLITAGLCTATFIVLRARAVRPGDLPAALLLATGLALVSVGQGVALLGHPSPSYADIPRLLAYPVLAAAVVTFQRDRIHHDRASLLDALVLTVAAAQAGWLALIQPILRDSDASLATVAVTGAYPLGDLLVLSVLARLCFAVDVRDGTSWLLAGGLGVGLAGEIATDITNRGLLASAWLPGLALCTIAALGTGFARRAVRPDESEVTATWRFVILLGVACLVTPVLVLSYPIEDRATMSSVVMGASGVLFTLALLRILSLVTHLRHSMRREQVLRETTASLVRAADRAGVRDAAMQAALDLVEQAGSRAWRVDSDPGGSIAQATDDLDLATFLDSAEIALLPDARTGIDILDGPSLLHATLGVPSSRTLVMVALPARGPGREAAIVSAAQRPSAGTVASLRSLAQTMSLALERLDVGAVLVERRSERRLRLMLQYASDVICILDHDLTIVHVTPAVEPIVGLPAPELLGMNWLDLVVDENREAAEDLVTLAQGGRPARGDLRLNNESGHRRHVDAVVTEVIDEDLMGFVVTCHDVTERHDLAEELAHQAFHDSLTKLANRALFRDRLGHAMARARGSDNYAVLFIDLDDFKTVNDSLGHAAGDALLKEMTGRLRECLRDGDTAARLGGDEFAVLLEDMEDDNHSVLIAERLLEALGEPFAISSTEVTTSASIGIALGNRESTAPEDLMRNADLALYEAKNSGKNRYAVFAQTMHDKAKERLSLTSDLRRAVERGELIVFYQPLVDLQSGRITGLEALVRWAHPTKGMLQPGDFIQLAEETGLIVPLGRTVLRTALFEAVRWQRNHPEHQDLHIAVNVSGRQLMDSAIVEDVTKAIHDTGINPNTVVLEITETVLLPGDGGLVERLDALAALGVHLYIDDFGTGYSSLSYLQQLPVNGLKLAQEFVENLPGGDADSGLVRTIRDLADTLGLTTVVAEGIERDEQWRSLVSLGYRIGQGFRLAVPMPAERVPDFLVGVAADWPTGDENDWHAAQQSAGNIPAQVSGESAPA